MKTDVPRLSFPVGYAQNALQNGATMVTAQFLGVDTTDGVIQLDSIAPTGDDLDDVNIQLLSSGGTTVATYFWNTYMYDTPRWVDSDMLEVDGVSFAPGQGLWVGGSSKSQNLQTVGKVATEDIAVQLQNGATATGNPFPTAIALADIYPTGDDLDDVNIQLLSSGGTTVTTYFWNTYMYDTPRWVDGDMLEVCGVNFVPGQGLWVGGSSTSQYLNFPAPEL